MTQKLTRIMEYPGILLESLCFSLKGTNSFMNITESKAGLTCGLSCTTSRTHAGQCVCFLTVHMYTRLLMCVAWIYSRNQCV